MKEAMISLWDTMTLFGMLDVSVLRWVAESPMKNTHNTIGKDEIRGRYCRATGV
jgi:hypothetical protein